jgi:pyruvate kinase
MSDNKKKREHLYQSITSNLNIFLKDIPNEVKVKTKTVCTLGPASWDPEIFKNLLLAGCICARFNFSHGDHETHEKNINMVRKVTEEENIICSIMLDTKGPEIRTCKLSQGNDGKKERFLKQGDKFRFLIDENVLGDNTQVAVTYKNLVKVIKKGDIVLVDDGLISFSVIEVTDTHVDTLINNNGWIGENKGVNLPGVQVDLPAVTEKDKKDIEFGVKHNVDFIAASFIRNKANVEEIRNLPGVRENNIKIISKIENAQGMENFLEILEASDGIMVARGDLAVEIPLEKVPTSQKMMIRHCNRVGKPVITATQMMESMTTNPRPTRAEVTDVANAVFDGTDCVMLSGESAKGKYPVETVRTMGQICKQAESDINYRVLYKNLRADAVPPIPVNESVASSAVKTCWDLNAALIIGLTETGTTVRLLSKYRPHTPIICVTDKPQTARQILLSRAAYPLLINSMSDSLKINKAIAWAKQNGFIRGGDRVIIVAGVLEGQTGGTNLMKIETVPEN